MSARPLLTLAALVGLSAAAHAAWFRGNEYSLDASREQFEQEHYDQVIARLDGELLGRLRGAQQRLGYYYLGVAYERLNKLDKAVGVYQLGVRLHPRDINLLSQLAGVLHRSGLEEQAEPVYQKILMIHPNNALAHLGLAEIDHSLGFAARSAEHYEKTLETMGDRPEVWSAYSEVLLSGRDAKTAELAARRSLSLKDSMAARYALARAVRAAGRLDEAIVVVSSAAAAYASEPGLALTLALWQLEAGRFDQALAGADKLIAGPHPPPLAYWIRARTRLKDDRYTQAVADLKAAAEDARGAPFTAAAADALRAELGAK